MILIDFFHFYYAFAFPFTSAGFAFPSAGAAAPAAACFSLNSLIFNKVGCGGTVSLISGFSSRYFHSRFFEEGISRGSVSGTPEK